MRKLEQEFLVYEGEYFEVEFYFNNKGNILIWSDFINLIDREQATFLATVEKIANAPPGVIHPKTIFNIEDSKNKIWAIKFGKNRFCSFFYEGKKIIITNAYKKKSQKNTRKEALQIKKASQYKKDYQNRIKIDTYYPKIEDL